MIRPNRLTIATRDVYKRKDWAIKYSKILSTLAKGLNIMPLSIVYIDNRLMAKWNTRLNHPKLISSLFDEKNVLDRVFLPMKKLNFNVVINYEVDIDEKIVCEIRFKSEAEIEENRLEKYPEPKILRSTCGVAKIGRYNPNTSLEDCLSKVLNNSEDIFSKQFEKSVIQPISSFIAKNEEGEAKRS